jgi:hypothetical protein
MKKPERTAVAGAMLAVAIIGYQFTQNARLRDELESTRRASAAMPSPLSAAPVSAAKSSLSGSSHPAAASPASPAGAPGQSYQLRDILALRDPAARLQGLMEYVNGLSWDKLRAAIAELQESTPEWDPEAKFVLHMMLTRWAKEDPDAALASLDTIEPKNRGERASSIFASLAAADPKRAAAWLASENNKMVDFPFMGHILAGTLGKEWMRQDTDAALQWAAILPESQRGGAYVGILGTLAGTDPQRAAQLAATLEPGDARRNLLGDIGEAWARRSPREAAEWAQSLDPSDRPAALRDTLATWAGAEPEKAADYVSTLPADQITGDLLKSVAEPWTVSDASQAAAWVMAQEEGKARSEAIGGVLWNWTKRDPVAASSWLQNQPAGEARDSAIGGLALAAFDNDPAGAVTWASQMSDQSRRNHSVTLGLTEWMKRDQSAATVWAQQNGVALPETR